MSYRSARARQKEGRLKYGSEVNNSEKMGRFEIFETDDPQFPIDVWENGKYVNSFKDKGDAKAWIDEQMRG